MSVQGSTTSGNDVFTSEEQPPSIYSSTVAAVGNAVGKEGGAYRGKRKEPGLVLTTEVQPGMVPSK